MLGRWGMANRPSPGLSISEFERLELQRLTRSSWVSGGVAQRARIVLLAGQGLSNTAIAERVGVSRPTVIAWRSRFVGRGLAGLADEPRSGRPRQVDRAKVIAATLRRPPKKYGVTHWSTRLLLSLIHISEPTRLGM